MKKSYKYSLASVATAVVIFNFTSCKYEDGPKISLKSKTARLTGEWEVTKLGDEDIDNMELIMEFEKDGDFTYDITYSYYGYEYSYKIKGEWEWEDKKEIIDLNIDGSHTELEVKRLTNKELWVEDEDGDEWELEKM